MQTPASCRRRWKKRLSRDIGIPPNAYTPRCKIWSVQCARFSAQVWHREACLTFLLPFPAPVVEPVAPRLPPVPACGEDACFVPPPPVGDAAAPDGCPLFGAPVVAAPVLFGVPAAGPFGCFLSLWVGHIDSRVRAWQKQRFVVEIYPVKWFFRDKCAKNMSN